LAELIYRSATKSGVIGFKAVNSITRPANTTQYAIGDLINHANATTLIEFDFGTENANSVLEINSITLMSDYAVAAIKLDPAVWFFNASTILSAGAVSQVTDNAAFAPSFAQIASKSEGFSGSLATSGILGTTAYTQSDSEKSIIVKLDSSGKIWAAITANNTYTPASGEVLRLTLKGYVLG
jgi:hypothetical protein